MNFGIATVVAITALVYIICLCVKASVLDNKWIPVVAGVSGVILGILALYIGVPDFPATDPMTAAAVGGGHPAERGGREPFQPGRHRQQGL